MLAKLRSAALTSGELVDAGSHIAKTISFERKLAPNKIEYNTFSIIGMGVQIGSDIRETTPRGNVHVEVRQIRVNSDMLIGRHMLSNMVQTADGKVLTLSNSNPSDDQLNALVDQLLSNWTESQFNTEK
jgi:hypothetical protein